MSYKYKKSKWFKMSVSKVATGGPVIHILIVPMLSEVMPVSL